MREIAALVREFVFPIREHPKEKPTTEKIE